MNRIAIYVAAAVVVVVPAVMLGNTLFASQEDSVERLVGSIEQGRVDTLLNAADFDADGLTVSAGHSARHFGPGERDAARALLEERTGLGAARSVRILQRDVRVRADRATAILNIALDQDEWVALRLELRKRGDQWRVSSVRVMG